MIENEETIRVLEEIYRKVISKIDSVACIQHYLVFGEIKVIYKDKEQQ